MQVGCHTDKSSIKYLRDRGIHTVQFFASNPRQYDMTPPTMYPPNYLYVIHSPFWVSFFNSRVEQVMLKYMHYLKNYWLPKNMQLLYVTHTSSVKDDDQGMIKSIHIMLEKLLKICDGKIKICLENTAGYKSSNSPSVGDLVKIKEVMNSNSVGLCIDTQHAYAAGQDLNKLPYDKADVIHMNAVPPYVKHGGHLDRHSFTPLFKSKEGTEFVSIIKKTVSTAVPIIMERRDLEISIRDVGFYRNLNV